MERRQGYIVKRVIGLPGETVEVRRGCVAVNGVLLVEDYISERGPLDIAKGRLAGGKFAVLGDNRSLPPEQTVHSILAKDQIVGRVVWSIRLWPRRLD
jgi:signal peptidase I